MNLLDDSLSPDRVPGAAAKHAEAGETVLSSVGSMLSGNCQSRSELSLLSGRCLAKELAPCLVSNASIEATGS